ncbi:XAC2610-related protein [Chryseobacterium sp. Leaf405]|uniref:XAC2610-related protein n=1 Tax=Chryseobacterium sp. Leaf405 TaxID=1736367 RepID=UPI000B126FF9|nr:hypothetical protein [Chryseobacterium sp. Leaf405]
MNLKTNVYTYLLQFLLGIACISCSQNKSINAYFSEEKFVDSMNIGLKGKTKVEIEKFRNDSTQDNMIILNFYEQDSVWNYKTQKNIGNIWRQINRFYFDKDGITGIGAKISDFNNDGFKDLTYQSGIAGRGGNAIQTLFIYDPKSKNFIHIKNSDHYPNLSYNPKLNCINSVILTGSTTTSFLKINNDSLDEFARVDVSDSILVTEKDAVGNFKIIEKKKFEGNDIDFYNVFRNYKPLEY